MPQRFRGTQSFGEGETMEQVRNAKAALDTCASMWLEEGKSKLRLLLCMTHTIDKYIFTFNFVDD